jgi:hypothetical protein
MFCFQLHSLLFSSSFHLFISCPILNTVRNQRRCKKYYQLFFCSFFFLFTLYFSSFNIIMRRELNFLFIFLFFCRHQANFSVVKFSFENVEYEEDLWVECDFFNYRVSYFLILLEHGKPLLNFLYSTCSQISLLLVMMSNGSNFEYRVNEWEREKEISNCQVHDVLRLV